MLLIQSHWLKWIQRLHSLIDSQESPDNTKQSVHCLASFVRGIDDRIRGSLWGEYQDVREFVG